MGIRRELRDMSDDIVYLIHSAELAACIFSDFDFMSNKIRANVYWFDNDKEIEDVIIRNLSNFDCKLKLITGIDDFNLPGEVFYLENDGIMYLLNEDKVYYADLNIISKLNQKNVDHNYIIEDNYIGTRKIKVLMKEIGLIDEIYSEQHYIDYLSKFDRAYYLLYLYRDIWKHKDEVVTKYNMDDKYNNPYENILRVEEYLNNLTIPNIDVEKCAEYDLKYDRLPARYNYNGFYSITGRIYCSSDKWTPIQNIPLAKRDMLYAGKGCIFVEIDYKSFEFDILCQIMGHPVYEDPHTKTYDDLVGIPHADSRDIGKAINYSFVYGMNEQRLADTVMNKLGVVPKGFKESFMLKLESNDMIEKLKFLESILKTRVVDSTVPNFFGRLIHFKKEFAILHNYISSSASDMLYNKMVNIMDLLDGQNKIILQNHDSILLQLVEKDIENSDILETILAIMVKPLGGLQGRIEYKYGPNWKNMV